MDSAMGLSARDSGKPAGAGHPFWLAVPRQCTAVAYRAVDYFPELGTTGTSAGAIGIGIGIDIGIGVVVVVVIVVVVGMVTGADVIGAGAIGSAGTTVTTSRSRPPPATLPLVVPAPMIRRRHASLSEAGSASQRCNAF